MDNSVSIGVLGAGSWGTALAIHLARNYTQVTLTGRNPQAIETLQLQRSNPSYLPGVDFPESLMCVPDQSRVIANSDYLLVVVPSTAIRQTFHDIHLQATDRLRGVIWATKGLEQKTGKFLHEVAIEEFGEQLPGAVLSGPSFAIEVGKGQPTAVTVASERIEFAKEAAALFHHDAFRAYTSTDIIGVEIGGTFKNILAIAAGIIDGLHFGANARAALITRGVAEMTRFGQSLGADPQTLAGLSGVGDIILSCTDDTSRNRQLGLALAKGHTLAAIEKKIGHVLEGQYAAKIVYQLAKQSKIEVPISEQVYKVLYDNRDPRSAVEALLARSPKDERS